MGWRLELYYVFPWFRYHQQSVQKVFLSWPSVLDVQARRQAILRVLWLSCGNHYLEFMASKRLNWAQNGSKISAPDNVLPEGKIWQMMCPCGEGCSFYYENTFALTFLANPFKLILVRGKKRKKKKKNLNSTKRGVNQEKIMFKIFNCYYFNCLVIGKILK